MFGKQMLLSLAMRLRKNFVQMGVMRSVSVYRILIYFELQSPIVTISESGFSSNFFRQLREDKDFLESFSFKNDQL